MYIGIDTAASNCNIVYNKYGKAKFCLGVYPVYNTLTASLINLSQIDLHVHVHVDQNLKF